ncbi:MAG: MotE family protein [Roseobacter sp.]
MAEKKRKSIRRKGRGSVLLICSLLLGSAAIRVGGEAGKAVATENPMPTESVEDKSKTAENETYKETAKNVLKKEAVGEMLAAFQKREDRIEKLEREIAIREKALTIADQEIEKRLQVLEQAEQSLRAMLALADTAAEDDLLTLTTVYENMKPKDAAALFEEMEPAFAAGFLGRMRPDAAAGIMAGLTPQKAYTVSVILAGRNADVPKG